MNLVILFEEDFVSANRVCVSGRRHVHIRSVLGAGPGDTVACGKLDGNMGSGRIEKMDDRSLVMQVSLDQPPPAPVPMTLVLALPRPKMLRRIIQNVTALGVKQVYLVNSWRVEKSFWQSPFLKEEQLESYARLGLEQAKDTLMPEIQKKRFFSRFVKNELPGISRNTRCIAAHPKSREACPTMVTEPVTLAVGPEGGWIDLEVQTFESVGFACCHMGPRILTVETAVISLISRLFA